MKETLEPLVEIQRDLTPPDGRDFWTSPQLPGRRPLFSTREVAFIFFAWSNWTMHMHISHTEMDIAPRTEKGYRKFQLHHVELLAHMFLDRGIIDLDKFRNCIVIIKAIARNYGLL
jgi:hypothetical protein